MSSIKCALWSFVVFKVLKYLSYRRTNDCFSPLFQNYQTRTSDTSWKNHLICLLMKKKKKIFQFSEANFQKLF